MSGGSGEGELCLFSPLLKIPHVQHLWSPVISISLKWTQASRGYSLRPWLRSEIVGHSLKTNLIGVSVQAKWTGDSWRCWRVAGDSFVTAASPHLSLFTVSQALAGPWGHRDPAFEEFTDQMREQMRLVLCDGGSGVADTL